MVNEVPAFAYGQKVLTVEQKHNYWIGKKVLAFTFGQKLLPAKQY